MELAASYFAVNAQHPYQPPSVDDYLRLEGAGRIRHEYVAGEIFAMTGASLRHNRIAGRIFTALSNHLRGGPCQAYMSDVKVRLKINQDSYLYYPDVMVSCERQEESEYYLCSPKLIVEVLSPTTEAIDRREKAIHYRWIAALEEYVLVSQDAPEVTIYRRSRNWEPTVLNTLAATAEFRSLNLSMPLTQIYDEGTDSPAR